MTRGGRPASLFSALLGAAVIVGCAGDVPGLISETTVTQSGDTTIVVPALDGPTGRLVSDLVIGADESNPDAVFGRVADAAFGPGGTIYVVDSQADHVVRFDRYGAFERVVTRRGEGPGEISSATMIAVARDGRFAVAGPSEIELFHPSEAPAGTIDPHRAIQRPLSFDTAGLLFIHTGPAPSTAFQTPWTAPATNVRSIHVITRSRLEEFATLVANVAGERVDSTSAPFDLADHRCIAVGVGEPNEGRICMATTYSWLPLFDRLGDGRVVAARTDRYRLEIGPPVGAGGVTSVRPRRSSVEVGPGLKRFIDNEWMETNGAVWDTLFVTPTHKSLIAGLRVASDDVIWVRLHAPSERTENDEGEEAWIEIESRFDIFTPDGEHVGHVTGPADLTFRDARGDTVLATRTGAFGVHIVERFLIDWSGAN